MTTFDQEVMARTAVGEARGEGDEAMQAVMWTGLNRFNAKRWYSGQTIAGTFLKRMQYDCWMPSDSNYGLLIDLAANISLFQQALADAASIIAGTLSDPTEGATHYFDSSIAAPAWTQGATMAKQIGRLTFYKDVA